MIYFIEINVCVALIFQKSVLGVELEGISRDSRKQVGKKKLFS